MGVNTLFERHKGLGGWGRGGPCLYLLGTQLMVVLIIPYEKGSAHCHQHSRGGGQGAELAFMNRLLCGSCCQTPCQC